MSLKNSNNSNAKKKGFSGSSGSSGGPNKKPNNSFLSSESIRSSEGLIGLKSITDEDTSLSDSDQETARIEAAKREKLAQNKPEDTYQNQTTKALRKSTDVIIESITKELPKDMAGVLIWLNIIAGVLSLVFLTITWAQYLRGDNEDGTPVLLITIAMGASLGGQFFSWLGTIRSFSGSLIISVVLLIIEAITSLVFILGYLIFGENESKLLFRIFALIIILCLTIATIILNCLHIRRIRSLTKISQTSAKTQKDVKN